MYPRKCTPGQHCQMLVRGTFFRNIFSEKVLSKKYPRQHCPMLIQHCPMLLGSTFWRVHFGEKNVPSQKVLPKMYSQDYTHWYTRRFTAKFWFIKSLPCLLVSCLINMPTYPTPTCPLFPPLLAMPTVPSSPFYGNWSHSLYCVLTMHI